MIESTDQTMIHETGKMIESRMTYQLTGDKQLLKRLRDENDGHEVDVTGVLKSEAPQPSAPRGGKVGKTTIVVGGGQTPSADTIVDERDRMPILQVTSYEPRGMDCRHQ